MIKNDPNGPAFYKFGVDWVADYDYGTMSPTDIAFYEQGGFVLTYGNDFVAGVHGIKLDIQTHTDDSFVLGDTDKYTITLTTPWHADVVVTANSWLAATRQKVFIDGDFLSGGCDDWRLQFSELRFCEVDGSDNVIGTHFTLGAQDDSGTLYEPKKNRTVPYVTPRTNPMLSFINEDEDLTCTEHFADITAFNYNTNAKVVVDWWYRYLAGDPWIADEVDFEVPDPLESDCDGDCDVVFDFFYTNSSDMTINSEIFVDIEIDDLGEEEWPCVPGPGTPAIVRSWVITYVYRFVEMALYAERKGGPMRSHTTFIQDTCNGSYQELSTTTADSWTVSGLVFNGKNYKWRKVCGEQIQPCTCLTLPGVENDCLAPDHGPDTHCMHDVTLNVFWPENPDCGEENALDYAVSRSLKHAWALEKDFRLLVRRNDNVLTSWTTFDVDDPADVVKITWDMSSSDNDRLWLLTIRSGVLELRHSLTDLATWSSVVATFSCDMADIANTDNGLTFIYSIESGALIGRGYDNQASLVVGPITTNITGIDSGSPLGMDTSVKDGQRRIGVTFNLGGVATFMTSTDLTNFS